MNTCATTKLTAITFHPHAECVPGLANPALGTCGPSGENSFVSNPSYLCLAPYLKVTAPRYCKLPGPEVNPTQPPQTVTDPSQNYTLPAPTGVNSSDPYTTTAGIFKNDSGVLTPLLPGLKPGDTLTPEQIKNLTADPNNLPLVIVYTVNNTQGNDTTVAPLTIVNPPLGPTLPSLPATITKQADSGAGANMTGYLPPEIANYTSMFSAGEK